MMTFLEFVCRKILGRPVSNNEWGCPFCEGRRSLYLYQSETDNRWRFRCRDCRVGGDEYDFLKFLGVRCYGERKYRLLKLRQEFEALGSSSPQGEPMSRRQRLVAMAWADARDRLKGFPNLRHDDLVAVWIGGQEARKHGVTAQEVRDYWREFDEWVDGLEAEHLAECDEPECEAICCRSERGEALAC